MTPNRLHAARGLALWSLLASGILLVGCADLEAVRQFAKTSAATADYQAVIADYVASPERQKRYQPERAAEFLNAQFEERKKQRVKLEAAQKVLVEYMSALGDMAADDLPNVDPQIDALGKALEDAKFVGQADALIGKETATAAGSIAKVLVRVVLDHWRQAQTVRIIRDANDHVQTVVAGLREVVLKDFGTSLDIEDEVGRKYFGAPIAAASSRHQTDTVAPLARIMQLEYADKISERRAKLNAYAAVLEKIGKGHADLDANVDHLNDTALMARLKQYAKDLQVIYKAIAQ